MDQRTQQQPPNASKEDLQPGPHMVVYSRMRMPRILTKRWVFAVVGSLLILISTFATGYIVDHEERRVKNAEEEAREVTHSFEESARGVEDASSSMSAAASQLVGAGFSPGPANSSMRASSMALLYRAVELDFRRSLIFAQKAAGPYVDQDAVDNAYTALKKIEENGEGIGDFEEPLNKILDDADIYQTQLLDKLDDLEKEKAAAEQTSARTRTVAIVLQVVGLVLLLSKEFPVYLSPREANESQSSALSQSSTL